MHRTTSLPVLSITPNLPSFITIASPSLNEAITSQLAQITYKMQSEMAAFSVCIDIYIEKTNGFIK